MANILLVDDDENVRYSIAKLLKRNGHTVSQAENGAVALKMDLTKVELLITDIIMPEVEGLNLLMKLKSCLPFLPVIVISGGGRVDSADYLKAASGLGADAVFNKPIDEPAFLAAVTRLNDAE